MLGEDCPIPQAYVDRIRDTGTPFFRSPERAFRALVALKGLERKPAALTPAARNNAAALEPGVMPEYRAKLLLARLWFEASPRAVSSMSLEEALTGRG